MNFGRVAAAAVVPWRGVAWVVDMLLEMALYGVIVGLVYRPIARRTS